MDFGLDSSWSGVFGLENSIPELFLRGTVLYLVIIAFMRFMPRRTTGDIATTDLILLFLIAHAAGKAIGDYTSVTDAVLVVAILLGWSYVINLLSYHVPLIERLLSAPSLPVVRNGKLLRRNMRSEFLTEGELMDHLRHQGFDDLKDVKEARVESEGRITVIGVEK